jgi:hypothetical protein
MGSETGHARAGPGRPAVGPAGVALPAAGRGAQRRRAGVPHVVGDVDGDGRGNDLVDAVGQFDPVGGQVGVQVPGLAASKAPAKRWARAGEPGPLTSWPVRYLPDSQPPASGL